jgi:hypothetical protein
VEEQAALEDTSVLPSRKKAGQAAKNLRGVNLEEAVLRWVGFPNSKMKNRGAQDISAAIVAAFFYI